MSRDIIEMYEDEVSSWVDLFDDDNLVKTLVTNYFLELGDLEEVFNNILSLEDENSFCEKYYYVVGMEIFRSQKAIGYFVRKEKYEEASIVKNFVKRMIKKGYQVLQLDEDIWEDTCNIMYNNLIETIKKNGY
jgi:hypothetical protein